MSIWIGIRTRVRSNKELAHLTTARLPEKSPKRDWPVRDLVLETTKLMEDFAKQASVTRLHQCVSKMLSDQSSRVPDTPPTIPGSGSIVGGTHSIVVPDDC
jgi:hypothetical protein